MSKKYKLIVDCRMLNHSGIGKYIKECIVGISKEIEIIMILNSKDVSFAKEKGIKFSISNAPIYSLREQFIFLKFWKNNYIYWSPHYNVPILKFPWQRRITTIHDVFHLAHFKELSLFKKLYAKFFINFCVYYSDLIFTVSQFSRNEIIKFTKCSPLKIKVVYNGVHPHKQILNGKKISEINNLPEHFILFVGNIKPHKNLKILIDAYVKLDKNVAEKYKLVIVGKIDGFITEDKSLFTQISENSLLRHNVHFFGYVEDEILNEIYSVASVFVFPSLYEGFGIPTIEAMSFGCPVLASNIPVLKEICSDAALYFDPGDSLGLKNLLELILTSPTEKATLIQRGFARVETFTWDLSIQFHLKEIKLLLNM